MDILGLQIFVSLVLVVGAVVLFAWSAKQGDHDQGDRLSLLPMEDDAQPASLPGSSPAMNPLAPRSSK